MNAVADSWLFEWRVGMPAGRHVVPAANQREASRAQLKADMLALESRIAASASPRTQDLVELAAVGASVAESGPRGGQWLQRSRAEQLVRAIESRIQNTTVTRIEDFVKLVLAAAVVSRNIVQASPQAMSAAYQAANAQANERVSPSVEALVQLALVGAAWAQSGPRLSLAQLRAKRKWALDKVLAYRAPQAQEFIELAVLEVAVQVAERHEQTSSAHLGACGAG